MNKFKKLLEKRAQDVAEMELLTNTAEAEERAMTEDEQARFSALEAEIRAIDATVEAGEKARKLDKTEAEERAEKKADEPKESTEEAEERAFADYVRAMANGVSVEVRADDVNLTKGENGAVIPTSIANKIIEQVKNICPIYSLADRYNVKGTLSIPYYDESEGKIEVAYSDEFEELTSTSGKFASITLQACLAGALTKISKSLVNNSQFDIVSYVIRKMAEAISLFLEKELLVGNATSEAGKATGLYTVRTIDASAATVVTSDELIDLQEEIPDAYQGKCVWIMSKKTRTAIRKLKDGQGNYLLEKDFTARWGYKLLGADVYVSDAMPDMAAGKNAILYGDFSGLALKLSEEMEIEVLREKFATQHAVGVVAWIEFDSKIENAQKVAALKMANA